METLPDQTVLCLSRKEASVNRLVVPETARGSLGQVLRYEVDRLLPVREEEIYYDYVTTEEGGEDRRLGIVIFCLPRQTVDPLVNLLVEYNLRPQRVTLSSAAQATVLLTCCPVAQGQQVLAVRDGDEVELNFLRERQFVASQTVPLARVAEAATWTNTLAHSITRNFPGRVPGTIPVFIWDEQGVLPVRGEPDRDLADAARAQCPPGAAAGGLSVVSGAALGAALQAVGEGRGINVLAAESRAPRAKLLSPLTLVFVGGLLGLSLVWAASAVLQDRRALRQIQEQIQALAPAVRQVQEDETDVLRLQAHLSPKSTQWRVAPPPQRHSGLPPPLRPAFLKGPAKKTARGRPRAAPAPARTRRQDGPEHSPP